MIDGLSNAVRPGLMPCGRACLSLAFLWLALASTPSLVGSIVEPSTIFYGRIIATGVDRPFLATAGELAWTIRRADGTEQTFRTKLLPLNRGTYSYRLNVPHSALASGLDVSQGRLPLRAVAEVHLHAQIRVNGKLARILTPDAGVFIASQKDRAASHRLDLQVALDGTDTDGDGVPDWWEDRYAQHDPLADPDADGLNNRAEFLGGTDPGRDDRAPALVTTELRAYAGGTTLLALKAFDANSPPSEIRYTLLSAPEGGALKLRNAAPGNTPVDQVLELRTTFTQSDVDHGRVVFVQNPEAGIADTSFTLVLNDEDSAHTPSTNHVRLLMYEPAAVSQAQREAMLRELPWSLPVLNERAATDQARLAGYLLAREYGHIVWDGSMEKDPQQVKAPSSESSPSEYETRYRAAYGPDRSHVLLGGLADDRITGSMEADILIGGQGNDVLRGRAGSDLFVLLAQEDGNDVIDDYSLAENDTIDLSRVLTGTSTSLTSYLQVSQLGSDTLMRLNFAGSGTTYADMTLTLRGVLLTTADLFELVDSGRLVTGGKSMPARVSIVASAPSASENGPVAGAVTLNRTGTADSELVVPLRITGSANNGTDFEYVPAEVVFAAGQRGVTIPIVPYVDTVTELTEVVDVAILPAPGLSVVGTAAARVTIEDLAPQLRLEILQSVAVRSQGSPAMVAIHRGGVLDRSVLVRLEIGGSAVNGLDYAPISTLVNLAAGETVRLITITPNPSANLTPQPKSVRLTLKPDPSYNLATPASAQLLLVDAAVSLAGWRARFFPDSSEPLDVFALRDPGNHGIPNLLRYAYGLDPNDPDPSRMPHASLQEGHLTLEYWRRPDATDLAFAVEVSEDLARWTDSPLRLDAVTLTEDEETQLVRYRALPPVSADSTRFMRVRVTYSP